MNGRIKELIEQAKSNEPFECSYTKEQWLQKYTELIVRECARIVRNTDLEDVEGGDSSVLLAAKHHILDHFGVEEYEWFDEDPPC